MMRVSRRTAVLGGAVIPFAQWFATQAQARAPRIRRDLSTPAGQADLAKYAQAVKLMMARPEADTRGWMFEWYIHFVRGDRSKAAEIARVYPAASPARTLALASWSTCQAHSGQNEDYFLPWHRMYVFFLESVCQNLLNDPTFALPYWRYTQPNQRSLPAPFRVVGSQLYRPNRNGPVNNGAAIDQGLNPTPINTSSLSRTTYSGNTGFCATIDGGLHGSVHVLVGNGQGMGSVPWAGNDPIFWMHHSNIDRMWASWNKNGGCNPTDAGWLNKTFTFPDGNGNSIVAKIGDFKSIGALGYTYDTFEPGPVVGRCPPLKLFLDRMPHVAILKRPIKLDPLGPVSVTLELPPEAMLKGDPRMLQAAPRTGKTMLVIEDLQAQVQPGVLFAVGVASAPGARPKTVGHINFFDAVPLDHGDDKDAHAGHERTDNDPDDNKAFSFDITGLVRKGAKPVITLTPVGKADAKAEPVVNGFRIVTE